MEFIVFEYDFSAAAYQYAVVVGPDETLEKLEELLLFLLLYKSIAFSLVEGS